MTWTSKDGTMHPSSGDMVTAAGLAHIDQCQECNPRMKDVSELPLGRQPKPQPNGELQKPADWNVNYVKWVPTVCEICGANVFTVNVAPHLEWHKRTGTD